MNKTFKLTCTAMLCALAVLANLYTIPLTANFSRVISFTTLVTFVAGIYFGPICGMTVGFVGDVVAHFIQPMGGMSYNWFIGLSCLLTGLFAGLAFKYGKKNRLVTLVVALVTCFVVCTSLLNNFGLWLQIVVGVKPSPSGLFVFFATDPTTIRKTFWVFMWARTPVAALNCAINGVLVATLLQTKVVDKLLRHFDTTPQQQPTQTEE